MKKNLLILVLFILSFLILIFTVDFRINSKIFINRQIINAFDARVAGDEKKFLRFLNDSTYPKMSWDDSHSRYLYVQEHKNDLRFLSIAERMVGAKIINYEILKLSYNIGDDTAFVLLKILREKSNIKSIKEESFITYKLFRINNIWKIDYLNNEGVNVDE